MDEGHRRKWIARGAQTLGPGLIAWLALAVGCLPPENDGLGGEPDDDALDDDAGDDDAGDDDTTVADDDDTGDDDTGDDDAGDDDTTVAGDPFADAVVSFTPGEGAGFGQSYLPDVVRGPPEGAGEYAGSLHVVSLGRDGEIVLELIDQPIIDGPGPDLLVFENPFTGWIETGYVAVSEDGVTWAEWPCDPDDVDGGQPGCSGVTPVLSHPDNGVDPTDPAVAGGDAFDLADLGLTTAWYVRVRDSGVNAYGSPTGGYDLDAIAVVHTP